LLDACDVAELEHAIDFERQVAVARASARSRAGVRGERCTAFEREFVRKSHVRQIARLRRFAAEHEHDRGRDRRRSQFGCLHGSSPCRPVVYWTFAASESFVAEKDLTTERVEISAQPAERRK
jgi:hypothetical protein